MKLNNRKEQLTTERNNPNGNETEWRVKCRRARDYIRKVGGFEMFAEWGLV